MELLATVRLIAEGRAGKTGERYGKEYPRFVKLSGEETAVNLGQRKLFIHYDKFVIGPYTFDVPDAVVAIDRVKKSRALDGVIIDDNLEHLDVICVNPEGDFVFFWPAVVFIGVEVGEFVEEVFQFQLFVPQGFIIDHSLTIDIVFQDVGAFVVKRYGRLRFDFVRLDTRYSMLDTRYRLVRLDLAGFWLNRQRDIGFGRRRFNFIGFSFNRFDIRRFDLIGFGFSRYRNVGFGFCGLDLIWLDAWCFRLR